ncbi:MAG: LPS assembly lipoprotein LptE [Thermoguttaceae bacterium]
MQFAICNLLLLVAGCAGYQIGNRALFPEKSRDGAPIETVYVPVFESASFRRQLGEQLTEAVVKEIERRTPYKVVGDPGADTVLVGRIAGDDKHLVLETRRGDPRESQGALHVQVCWRERDGTVLREGRPIPLPADCVAVTATSDLVPEAGQSTATAQMQTIQRLARQIVSLMEAQW